MGLHRLASQVPQNSAIHASFTPNASLRSILPHHFSHRRRAWLPACCHPQQLLFHPAPLPTFTPSTGMPAAPPNCRNPGPRHRAKSKCNLKRRSEAEIAGREPWRSAPSRYDNKRKNNPAQAFETHLYTHIGLTALGTYHIY